MGRTGRKKKSKTHVPVENKDGVPQSFVLHTGNVGQSVESLMRDMRKVMEPNTATKLKMRKGNVLKDFIHVAGPLGVTHFMIFNQTEMGTNMRVARLPRGPTATFRVTEYSLRPDVIALQKRPPSVGPEYLHPPLLVLNNFTKDSFHLKLLATMFQNMFPSISIDDVNLNDIRRCALFHYDPDKNAIEFRHYLISAQPVGISRAVKKIIHARIPDLSKVDDIADFVQSAGAFSDSEAELDNEDAQVVLPQRIHGVGNTKSQQSAIKLTELGPRMTLNLIKIEQGFCEGDVLHHEHFSKTPEEIEATRKALEQKRKEKERRKKEQEENVRRKQAAKEAHKAACMSGMANDDDKDEDGAPDSDANAVSDDDDAEYYRQEVGEEPEPELFSRTNKGGSDRGAGGKRWQNKGKPKGGFGKRDGPGKKPFKGGKESGKGSFKGKKDGQEKASFKGSKRPADGHAGERGSKKFKSSGKGGGGAGPSKKKVSGFIRKKSGGRK